MKLFDPPRLTGKYLSKTLASGWLTSGPRCQELQEATAAFIGCRPEQVVLASSATAAWQGILDLLGHVVVRLTPATWPGMYHVIRNSVAGLWYPSNDKWDVRVETDIGGRRLSDYDKQWVVSGRWYVHDACHSWLPDPKADFGLVSFYPTKLVPGAEGGAVICKRPEDAEQLRLWLYCGLKPGGAARGETPAVWGRKANMTDVTAALNLEALELAPKHIQNIEEAWCTMSGRAYWLQIGHLVRQQNERPYLFQIDYDFKKGPPTHCPWARNFAPANLLTLPCYPGLSKAQAQDILEPFAKPRY